MAELNIAIRLDAIPGDLRGKANLSRSLATASQLGASAVELCARTTFRPSELSDTGLRQLRKMLEDLNLRVASVRFQTRRGYDTLDDLDRRVEATKQAMKLAYRLGSPVVVNQIGRVPDPSRVVAKRAAGDETDTRATDAGTSGTGTSGTGTSGDPFSSARHGEDPEVQRWQTLQAVLEDLGRFGSHVGSILAAETGTEPGEWLAELLDASDEAFVGVALNPGQLIINRHSVRDAVIALRHRVAVVAAVDGVLDLAAGRGLSVPLGQGTADFPEIIGRLEEVPYRGPFVLGRPRFGSSGPASPIEVLDELRQGVAYLREF